MYKLMKNVPGLESSVVHKINDDIFIPFDTANSDYQRYLKWLDGYEETHNGWVKTSDGNTPLPADQE